MADAATGLGESASEGAHDASRKRQRLMESSPLASVALRAAPATYFGQQRDEETNASDSRMPISGIPLAELASSDLYIPAHLRTARQRFLKSCADAPSRATRTREFLRKMALPTFTARDLATDASPEAVAAWKETKTVEMQRVLSTLAFPALSHLFEDEFLAFQHTVGESTVSPVYHSWLHRTGYAARAVFDDACFNDVLAQRDKEKQAAAQAQQAEQEVAAQAARDQAFARMTTPNFIRDEITRQLDTRKALDAAERMTRRPGAHSTTATAAPTPPQPQQRRPKSYAQAAAAGGTSKPAKRSKDKGKREQPRVEKQQAGQAKPKRKGKARQKPSDDTTGNEPRPRQQRQRHGNVARGPTTAPPSRSKAQPQQQQRQPKKNKGVAAAAVRE